MITAVLHFLNLRRSLALALWCGGFAIINLTAQRTASHIAGLVLCALGVLLLLWERRPLKPSYTEEEQARNVEHLRRTALSCGATRPCAICKMSEKNSVHRVRGQFGYHTYQEIVTEEADSHEHP